MPDITPNLGIKKPLGSEYVKRLSYNENLDLIDSNAATKAGFEAHKTDVENHIKIKTNITIFATGWTDDTANSGYWKYDIVDADITAASVVDVNIRLEDLEKADSIKSACVSSAGKVTIYADGAVAADILADLKIVRQVV
mgnify:FL=1